MIQLTVNEFVDKLNELDFDGNISFMLNEKLDLYKGNIDKLIELYENNTFVGFVTQDCYSIGVRIRNMDNTKNCYLDFHHLEFKLLYANGRLHPSETTFELIKEAILKKIMELLVS